MSNVLRTTIASTLALALTTVVAQPLVAADASAGAYLGAGVGQIKLSESDDDLGLEFDGDDTAFKVLAGYQFNPYIGIEGAYLDGGSVEDTVEGVDISLDTSGFEASLVGTLPIGEHFAAYARAGVLFWNVDITATDGIDTVTLDDDGNDFSYAAGAALRFGKVDVRLEYASADLEDTDLDLITLSALWRFTP